MIATDVVDGGRGQSRAGNSPSNRFQEFCKAKKSLVNFLKAVQFCKMVTADVCIDPASVARAFQKFHPF